MRTRKRTIHIVKALIFMTTSFTSLLRDKKLLFILNLDTGAYKLTSTVSGLFEGQPDQVARIVNNAKSDSTLYFCEDGASMNGVHGRDKTDQFFTVFESIDHPSETTGLTFSPDGRHMYVSFQYQPGHIFDITREDGFPLDGPTLDIIYH